MELSGKQKQFLKKEAHHLKPIFQIGKGGLSEELFEQVVQALEKRELIKIALLQNTNEEITQAASEISEHTGATVAQIIGHTIVLYKKSSKEKNRIISAKFERAFAK